MLFPSSGTNVLNVNNFRNRIWAPAIEASGVRTPAWIYDLRSTFASNALAAGIKVFELARVMARSVEMIERHYGTLLDGSGEHGHAPGSVRGRARACYGSADHRSRIGRLGHYWGHAICGGSLESLAART